MPNARRWIIISVAAIAVVAIVLLVVARQMRPRLHEAVVTELSTYLDSQVTLESFDVQLFPRPAVTGRGLVIRHQGRTDIPPLVTVGSFSGSTSWWRAFARQLDDVRLEGLEIVIPPRRREDMPSPGSPSPGAGGPSSDAVHVSLTDQVEAQSGPRGLDPRFVVHQLTATNGRITIMPRRDDKDPLVFDIHSLVVGNLTFVEPSTFEADLTNPIPFGRIKTTGTFGPWAREEPSDTPLEGRYQLNADLGTIRGIAGMLDAEGTMEGTLSRIATTGRTNTQGFSIPKLNAEALPLSTAYQAVVNGTNGDVELERVESTMADSHFVSTGSIVGTKGIKGKRVILKVTSDDARMEDLLRLTVSQSPPPMTGRVTLETAFDLPQGDRDVVDRLLLEGKVAIETARFTSDNVQGRIDELSRRGQGRPEDQSIDNVASNLSTGFVMKDGTLTFTNLTYSVEGAKVQLNGTYTLASGGLDFAGEARLDASVSATQSGFRHFLLMPLDAVLRKGGAGTRVAITVGGTVQDPKFGVDFGRTLQGK